jgi:hypothetical protein
MAQVLTAAATLAEHPGLRSPVRQLRSIRLGLFENRNRRHVAILIRSDGRRVQVPVEDTGLVDVSLFGLLRSLELGIESVFVRITGSRRETGRRDKR